MLAEKIIAFPWVLGAGGLSGDDDVRFERDGLIVVAMVAFAIEDNRELIEYDTNLASDSEQRKKVVKRASSQATPMDDISGKGSDPRDRISE